MANKFGRTIFFPPSNDILLFITPFLNRNSLKPGSGFEENLQESPLFRGKTQLFERFPHKKQRIDQWLKVSFPIKKSVKLPFTEICHCHVWLPDLSKQALTLRGRTPIPTFSCRQALEVLWPCWCCRWVTWAMFLGATPVLRWMNPWQSHMAMGNPQKRR